ncbi:hypothetical protein ACFL2H_07800 [Planctomycetota bacterium]
MARFTKTCAAIITALAVLQLAPAVDAQSAKEKTKGSTVRVGTFDSRALAMAYYRSEAFKDHMKEMHARHEKAKTDGDEQLAKKLAAEGPALQELIHKQGFGTWKVDNLLEKIKTKIPEIADQADVDVIVSKWNIVYRNPTTKFIDVTDLMVKPFEPDQATLTVIKEIQEQDPVPLEKLKRHQH